MLPSLLYLVFLTFPYVSYQFTVSDLCDNERILDVYHYCPYASHYGLDAESCNMQCRKRSYACSAFIDTVICMCGDIPEDMVGNSYTCLLAQTEIWCTPEKGITVEIDVGHCENFLAIPYV
nr:hypothetical protein HmN_000888900 [Hymenolepis microstoma]